VRTTQRWTWIYALVALGAACVCATRVSAGGPVFVVSNTGDSGAGSLRAAVEAANASVDFPSIHFGIPGAGPHAIALSTALPVISRTMLIDGTTQPGFAGTPRIFLDGNVAGPGARGLEITGGGSTIRGLAIGRFQGGGIWLRAPGNGNTIQGNFIGTDATGTLAMGNPQSGIFVEGSSGNTIGGATLAARNLISNNQGGGIFLDGPGSGSATIQGNYVGLDVTGSAAMGNNGGGVFVISASNNLIGGPSALARNVISGNNGGGLFILSDSDYPGVPPANVVVQNNYVGTNSSGTATIGGSSTGISVLGAPGTVIGTPGAGNLISGNNGTGLFFGARAGANSTDCLVQGNFIGTNAAGTAAVRNSRGMDVRDSSTGCIIGGTAPGTGNVISGNGDGMVIMSDDCVIQGNLMGTGPTGAPVPNEFTAVTIRSSGNTIGGEAAGAGNTVAFTGEFGGVRVDFGAANNRIQGNSIFMNGGLAIDLIPQGPTPNDVGDADTGNNNLQNFPVLTSATPGASTLIEGSLNSTPNTNFTLEFFASDRVHPFGPGEAQTFLGRTIVTTDATGNVAFSTTVSGTAGSGQFVSATATDPDGNTSEVSAAVAVPVVNRAPVLTNPGPKTATTGTAFSLQLEAADPDSDPLTFDVTGLPGGLSASTAGLISGTPTAAGTFNVSATVSDGALADMEGFTLTVGAGVPGKIVVSKKALNFKVSAPRMLSRTFAINIKNQGRGPLAVTVDTLPPPFSVTAGGGSFTLASRTSRNVSVTFTPTAAGTFTQSLSILSSDPKKPTVSVRLLGKATGSF